MATVHVIGAGISGLAAATQLAAGHVPVKLYEATAVAGGRCRTTPHPRLGALDSGLHMIAGGDTEAFRYLDRIDARDRLVRVPSLCLPAASIADYLALARGIAFPDSRPMAHFVHEENPLYHEWMAPISRLRLHTPAETVSASALASMARAQRGGLYMAARTLSESFLEPALRFLDYCGGSTYFNHALTGLAHAGKHIATLHFARKKVALAPDDLIILATPPGVTQALLPDIPAPQTSHSAITLHVAARHREPPGTVRFLRQHPLDVIRYDVQMIRATLRIADGAWHADQPLLAARIWRQLQQLHPYLRGQALGQWAFCREKRAGHTLDVATVTAAPAPLRPHPQCILAGDWLNPAAPASIESAAASGHRAAAAAKDLLGALPARTQ